VTPTAAETHEAIPGRAIRREPGIPQSRESRWSEFRFRANARPGITRVFFSGRLRLNRQKQSGRIFIQPLSNSEESANYFFAAFFAFFFFFMAAMIVFLMMSVAVGRWSTSSVADLVLGLAPLP
jgi:hypothetical protein